MSVSLNPTCFCGCGGDGGASTLLLPLSVLLLPALVRLARRVAAALAAEAARLARLRGARAASQRVAWSNSSSATSRSGRGRREREREHAQRSMAAHAAVQPQSEALDGGLDVKDARRTVTTSVRAVLDNVLEVVEAAGAVRVSEDGETAPKDRPLGRTRRR